MRAFRNSSLRPPGYARRRFGLRRTLTFALLCLATLFSNFAHAVELRMEGEQMWLKTERASIQEFMRAFAHLGVRVEWDPELTGTVTAHIEGEDAERVLAELFETVGYVFTWEMMDGPLGAWPRLTGIQVFSPGNRHRIRPLEDTGDAFRVMRMPDGSGIEYIADEIILGFAPGSNREAIRVLIRELGGTVVESIPELGIYRIRLPPGTNVPALVEQLAHNPLVAEVEPNYAYRIPSPATGPDTVSAPQMPGAPPRAGAPPVAVLDSGLTLLPGMENYVVGGFNALQPDRPFTDTAGHGTQMALIASGMILPGGGATVGGVPILPIRTFNDDGVTSNFAQMRSIFYAADKGAAVLNMSWGTPAQSAFLEDTVARARRGGMVIVASAGNEPLNKPLYPAAIPGVIAVSATLADGSPWPQSNYGDFVFVSAPGTASFPVGYQGGPGSYAGTSIASAYVAHALGLYFEKHPRATAQQAMNALQAAVSAGGGKWDPRLGHGTLNEAALKRLLQ